jgi:hypothetical protein
MQIPDAGLPAGVTLGHSSKMLKTLIQINTKQTLEPLTP